MISSVPPARRAGPIRRTRKSAAPPPEGQAGPEAVNLPVPVGRAETIAPATPPGGAAAIDAQIAGQTGARRGLRAGAKAVDTATASYNRTEWSGAKDRRAPKGRAAKTDV